MVGYEQKPSNLPCDGYQEPGWTPGSWLAHPGTGNWVTSLYQVTELPGDAFMGVSRNSQTYRVVVPGVGTGGVPGGTGWNARELDTGLPTFTRHRVTGRCVQGYVGCEVW